MDTAFIRNADFSKGNWEFYVYLHEIGHAMGLSHPHEGGAQTLQSELDFINYTVMSYEDPSWAYFGSGSSRYFTISDSFVFILSFGFTGILPFKGVAVVEVPGFTGPFPGVSVGISPPGFTPPIVDGSGCV